MRNNKKLFIFSGLLIFLFISIGLIFYYSTRAPYQRLTKTSFNQLPHWSQDDPAQAFMAFKESCTAILKLDPNLPFSSMAVSGKVSQWQTICFAAEKIKTIDKENAKQFFEAWFVPYQVNNYFNSQGLFTGYYLPLIQGRLKKDKHFNIPIYGVPSDLVKVNLGLFQPDLDNKIMIAQVKNHRLYLYPNREKINKGLIDKNTPILGWTDNPIDFFFAQIQGSMILKLSNNKRLLIGYASSNGHPYTAIGKVLVENKILNKEMISMQTIREWLLKHPEKVDRILNTNASYVFFQILKGERPVGSQQVPLTPQRSLAVDTRFISLGTPIWLSTVYSESPNQSSAFQHLMIAQDTGGAIKGVIRADVYWGEGEKAANIAGRMNSPGQYWVLLPRVKF